MRQIIARSTRISSDWAMNGERLVTEILCAFIACCVISSRLYICIKCMCVSIKKRNKCHIILLIIYRFLHRGILIYLYFFCDYIDLISLDFCFRMHFVRCYFRFEVFVGRIKHAFYLTLSFALKCLTDQSDRVKCLALRSGNNVKRNALLMHCHWVQHNNHSLSG